MRPAVRFDLDLLVQSWGFGVHLPAPERLSVEDESGWEPPSVHTSAVSGSLCVPLSLLSTRVAPAGPRVHVLPGLLLGERRGAVVVGRRLPHAIVSSHSECFDEEEIFGGGMLMLRLNGEGSHAPARCCPPTAETNTCSLLPPPHQHQRSLGLGVGTRSWTDRRQPGFPSCQAEWDQVKELTTW